MNPTFEQSPEEPFEPAFLPAEETLRELYEIPRAPHVTEPPMNPAQYNITPHDEVGSDDGADDDLADVPPIVSETQPIADTTDSLGIVVTRQAATFLNTTPEDRQELPDPDIGETTAAPETPEPIHESTQGQDEKPTEPAESSEPREYPVQQPTLKPPPLTIRRTEKHTVLASNTHPDRELAAKVADKLGDGIPESWPEFHNGTGTSKYHVDNHETPTVIVKIRGDADTLKNTIKHASISSDPVARIARERSRLSVVNEMHLAAEVSVILNQEEPQQMARDAGFKSVDVVQPLASVVNSETGQRATAYAWHPGESVAVISHKVWTNTSPTSPERMNHQNYIGELSQLTHNLGMYLRAHGIDPRDLQPQNLIIETIDDRQHLRIIDIELYRRIP